MEQFFFLSPSFRYKVLIFFVILESCCPFLEGKELIHVPLDLFFPKEKNELDIIYAKEGY
jgi:hypothetical protein